MIAGRTCCVFGSPFHPILEHALPGLRRSGMFLDSQRLRDQTAGRSRLSNPYARAITLPIEARANEAGSGTAETVKVSSMTEPDAAKWWLSDAIVALRIFGPSSVKVFAGRSVKTLKAF